MLFCVLVLCVITSQVLTEETQVGVQPCSENQKVCRNGTCASFDGTCEEAVDCSEHGEGTNRLCKRRLPRQASSCILPPHPNNGMYEVSNVPNARPGQIFDSFVLTVNCRRGYGVVETSDQSGVTSSNRVYCINGIWLQSMPKCVRFCRLDPDPSVRYMCHIPNSNGYKPCDEYVAPGTSVGPVCNSPIYYSVESLLYMKCTAGAWDYVAKCKPECGRVTPEGGQLITNATQAKRGELPWHVGIYQQNPHFKELICGGSLISNNVVISAAHCFWHDVKKQLPTSEFSVAIGKLYRQWNDERDIGAQKSDVKEIMIPRLFDGEAANFQEDIAIVVLVTPFVYKTYVRPVCLNFDANFDSWQLRQGKLGKVAGWGYTEANGNASKLLKVVELPFINSQTCIETLPPSFREYLTGDKFCAGYTNGTALCKGDSGGGLAFADRELGIDRYYLRGVVSASPRNDDKICNDEVYTAFTKITKHEEFIKRSVAASTKKSCSSYQFQCNDGACVDIGAECNGEDCADGSDESNYLCTPETSTTNPPKQSNVCVLPPYPDHGTYKVTSLPDARPGQVLDSFVLTVTCDERYGIQAADAVGTIEGSKANQVYCVNGAWYQKMPDCVAFCKVQPDPSVRYTLCQVPGNNGFSDCQGYVPPGTGIIPTCNTPNYYSTDDFPFMKCVNGSWNYIAKCQPECGRVTPKGQALVVNGKNAERGELPWHVGLYTKRDSPFTQICNGALVSDKVVLSNAYCFFQRQKKLPASNFAVAVGKLYRPWNSDKDVDAQKSEITEVITPSRFQGDTANYQGDIAILLLETAIVYKTFIRPVCLDFDKKFERRQLQEKLGKVAGWGLTEANGIPSQVLKVVELPYVKVDICLDKIPPDFRPFITLDKFCAGYTNGTASVCKGDTGGGLAFPNIEQGIERYYLRGLVSVAPKDGVDLCNPNTYIGFTKISAHEDLIADYLPNDLLGGTASVCKGDTGGGLAFPNIEQGIERYYLRGLVSVAPKDGVDLCNPNTYIGFTKISAHEDLIADYLPNDLLGGT